MPGEDEFLRRQLGNFLTARRTNQEEEFWHALFLIWFERYPEENSGRYTIPIGDHVRLCVAIREREIVKNDLNAMRSDVAALLEAQRPLGHDWQEEMDIEWRNERAKRKGSLTFLGSIERLAEIAFDLSIWERPADASSNSNADQ
ncbi:hypothetical protein BD779DRAFT_1673533 [Infundibulicybe gibba]|nr:hypothetical protein BD779DRAFT_1673533 [Infundibulicybe gibba]